MEYNIRNIFVEKSYTKCARETIPRPKVWNSLFLLYANLRAIEILWNQAADHLVLLNIKLF